MRFQGLNKRMGEVERALMVEEPHWMRAQRAEPVHWRTKVDGAAELYVEYLQLLETEAACTLLQLERGREVTFAMLDSLWAMNEK